MKKIRVLDIQFENEIKAWEIPALRGAIVAIAGKEHILFHNHEKNGFRYSYPLIQYKTIHKKPHLLCIQEGIDEIHNFFENKQEGIFLGDRAYELKVEKLSLNQFIMQVWDKAFHYKLYHWLPLNQENHKLYYELDDDQKKKNLLQQILTGNILSLAKGIGWEVDKPIITQIIEIKRVHKVSVKKTNREVFDISFRTNVFLPKFMGLGKNASVGFGVVNEDNKRNNTGIV